MSGTHSIDPGSNDDDVPCGVVRMRADGTVMTANERFLRTAQRTVDEVRGEGFAALLSVGARIFFETRVMAVLQLGGEVAEIALDVRRPDGSEQPVLVNARRDAVSGAIVLAVFDAAERQDYERDLLAATRSAELSEQRLRILQTSTGMLATCATEAELLATAESIFRDAFRASEVVALLDEHGELVSTPGHHDGVAPVSADGIAGGTRMLERAQLDPRLLSHFSAADRVHALSMTPVLDEERRVGVVLCAYGRPRDLTVDAVLVHDALARQIALALSRLRLQSELRRLAREDPLTRLANRAELRDRFADLEAARREGDPASIALVFLDLDGFKHVNDELGHPAGDAVLVEVALRLASIVRSRDVLGRFGGDEFVVLCTGVERGTAVELGERLIEAVARPIEALAGRRVRASVGIAVASAASVATRDEVFGAADAAMYRSKSAGGGAVTVVEI